MCTYDYTPYRGCAKGQQHFYLQWMKCNKALENGNRHCPLDESVEVEELKKLSGNVLFCPLDNPIAVQQHEFLFLAGDEPEEILDRKKTRLAEGEEEEESRARSRSARSTVTRGRPTTLYKVDHHHSSENSVSERTRRTSRKKAPRELSPPPTPDSDRSDSPIPRPRTASGVKRLDDQKVLQDRREQARTRSHRRASSVEFAPLPTTKVTRPSPLDDRHNTNTHRVEDDDSLKARRQAVPSGPLSPGMRARLGLPASPDMHRRNSLIQRSRSESPMKAEFQFPSNSDRDGPATDPEFGHPLFSQSSNTTTDSSPEQRLEPFTTNATQPVVRRARTTIRSRAAEERMMRRIVEDKRAEEEFTTRLMPTPKREVKMTFPDYDHEQQADQAIGLGLSQTDDKRTITRAKSEARTTSRSKSPDLRVDVVPLPQRRNKYVRDESPNLGAIASKVVSSSSSEQQPVSEKPPQAPFSYVNTSIRSSRTAPPSDDEQNNNNNNNADSSTSTLLLLREKREARKSRRYDEQVAEAKKWAAARDQHFSSSVPSLPTAAYDRNLPPRHQSPPEPSWLPGAGGSRQSNDSGYLSGQQQGVVGGKPPQRRNTLHKHKPQPSTATTASMAPSDGSTFDMDVRNLQSYHIMQAQQVMKVSSVVPVRQDVVAVTALPVATTQGGDTNMSGGSQGQGQGGSNKASLLRRMGLKRKISSLWERNGGVAGVTVPGNANGAAAVAG